MYKVRKRDGKIVPFEIEKIKDAIIKAFEAEKRFSDKTIFLPFKNLEFSISTSNSLLNFKIVLFFMLSKNAL